MNLRSGDRVQRTASLLMGGVDMDRPGDFQADLDILAKKEGVLKDIEDKKNQIKEVHFVQKSLFFSSGVFMYHPENGCSYDTGSARAKWTL